MPSKKPIIHFNTDQWLIDKMKYIANENNRSLAKQMEYLCKQCIKEYESIHGEINIDESNNQKLETIVETWCNTFYKDILKKAQKRGTTPREEWSNYLNTVPDKKKSKEDFKLIQKYVEERIKRDEHE